MLIPKSLPMFINARLDMLSANGDPLVRLDQLVDWKIFQFTLERAFARERKNNVGRKPYPKLTMFKILILQSLYNLSDHQAEYQIRDRLSFMRFLNFSFYDDTPDEKTIWAFREVLTKVGYIDKLFNKFNEHLNEKGFGAKIGSIIDASIVSAPKQRNSKEDNDQIKTGKVPDHFNDNQNMLRQKDCDARWTKKNHQNYYGYKNHINIDAKYKLIRAFMATPANIADINCLLPLVDTVPKESNWFLWADSAYNSQEKNQTLTEEGFLVRFISKQYRHLSPASEQARQNTRRSKVRARVEHVFGFLSNSLNRTMVKTIGLARAAARIGLDNLAYNLCRFEQLQRLGVA